MQAPIKAFAEQLLTIPTRFAWREQLRLPKEPGSKEEEKEKAHQGPATHPFPISDGPKGTDAAVLHQVQVLERGK